MVRLFIFESGKNGTRRLIKIQQLLIVLQFESNSVIDLLKLFPVFILNCLTAQPQFFNDSLIEKCKGNLGYFVVFVIIKIFVTEVIHLIDAFFKRFLNEYFELSHFAYRIVMLFEVILPVFVLLLADRKLYTVVSSCDRAHIIIYIQIFFSLRNVIDKQLYIEIHKYSKTTKYQAMK